MTEVELERVELHRADDRNEQAALLAELEGGGIEAWPGSDCSVSVATHKRDAAREVLRAWVGGTRGESSLKLSRSPALEAPSLWTLVLLLGLVVSVGANVVLYRRVRALSPSTSGTVQEHWANGELRGEFRYPAGAPYPDRTRVYDSAGELIHTFIDDNTDGNAERSFNHAARETTLEDRDENGLVEFFRTELNGGREIVHHDADGDQVFERIEVRRRDEVVVRWTDDNLDSLYDRVELGLGEQRRAAATDADGDGFLEEILCADGRRFDAVLCDWR